MISRLNQYKLMWIFVHFDLPTLTSKQRRAYTDFRTNLKRDGFIMIQYSVYARHCNSRENAKVHKNRIKKWLPKEGEIMITEITDAQFGKIEFFKGKYSKENPETPQQLQIF